MMIDNFTHPHLAKSHHNIFIEQTIGAGHQAVQVAIDFVLRGIGDRTDIEEMREGRNRKIHQARQDPRLQLAPAAPERVEMEPEPMCHPMEIVEAHHVPVAPVLDAIMIGQGSAASLVKPAEQIMQTRSHIEAVGGGENRNPIGPHDAGDLAQDMRDVRQMLDHLEHHDQVEGTRAKWQVMVEVDRGPSFASRMILGGKYAPSTVLEHPRRHAVARADIQRDARLNLARDELDGSTDTLAHMVGDSLAGAEAIATGYLA